MAPLSFLDLPMEIKLKILHEVVYTPNPEQEDKFDMYIEWTPNEGFIVSEDVNPFSLFLVNKSFSVLAQQIFWSQNRFSILPPEHVLVFSGGSDDHIPSSRYAASYFVSQIGVLQPLPYLRSLDLRMFENREEEEIRSDWFAVLDHAIHQGRLNLDFLSINLTFYDDPDWESMPHDPNQLLSFIKSFVNGHTMLGYGIGVSWPAKGSLRKWRDAAIVETRF
ncbi:unnamed protein product [Clonostachys rhizophaga]|uniref:Uncharacterized protein n=1 Tax=Clonostachys rhizophaga TaxID=160324 RepID=A0A9N9W3U1_9HYPO|nr:unnamed protein product [Clonostachys rhizophaga]